MKNVNNIHRFTDEQLEIYIEFVDWIEERLEYLRNYEVKDDLGHSIDIDEWSYWPDGLLNHYTITKVRSEDGHDVYGIGRINENDRVEMIFGTMEGELKWPDLAEIFARILTAFVGYEVEKMEEIKDEN